MGYYLAGDGNCYGRGDYYRGDYYRGDPGLFGFLAKGAKAVGKALVRQTPVGIAAGVIRQLATPARPQLPFQTGPFGLGGGFGPGVPDYGPIGPGVPGGVLVGGGQAGVPLRPSAMCIVGSGRRLNKSTYVTRGGGTSAWPQQLLVHPKGTECVKSRRMNVTNVRALRKAIRRATGFAKLSRRVLSFVQAKAPTGKALFKKKR